MISLFDLIVIFSGVVWLTFSGRKYMQLPCNMSKTYRLSRTLIVAISLLAALCLTLSAGANPGINPADMWVLKQKSDIGNSIVYIIPNAIRIDDTTHHYSLLCKAPTWKVSMFRVGEKIVYEESLKDWLQIGSAWYTASNSRPIPSKFVGPVTRTKLNDIPCLTARIADSTRERIAPDMLARDRVQTKTVTGYVYYLSDEIKTSVEVCEFLQKRYYLPKSPQIPIALKTLYSDAPPAINFLSLSATRTKLQSKCFEYPKGFRRIDSEWTIILGKNKDASMTNWMKDLDLGSQFGKGPNKRTRP